MSQPGTNGTIELGLFPLQEATENESGFKMAAKRNGREGDKKPELNSIRINQRQEKGGMKE